MANHVAFSCTRITPTHAGSIAPTAHSKATRVCVERCSPRTMARPRSTRSSPRHIPIAISPRTFTCICGGSTKIRRRKSDSKAAGQRSAASCMVAVPSIFGCGRRARLRRAAARRSRALQRRGLVEVELLARPTGHRRVAVRLHERLNFLEHGISRSIVEGNERGCQAGALMKIVKCDLFHGKIEIPKFVADAAHDHALVFQRLRVGNVQLEESDRYKHKSAECLVPSAESHPLLGTWHLALGTFSGHDRLELLHLARLDHVADLAVLEAIRRGAALAALPLLRHVIFAAPKRSR